MESYDFMVRMKKAVANYLNNFYKNHPEVNIHVDWTDVFEVWSCKTLQNNKIILAAHTPDQFLFEATYNGERKESYLDVYDKIANYVIEDEH